MSTVNIWEDGIIRLRAIEPDDWKKFYQWDQDTSVIQRLDHINFPRSKASAEEWAKTQAHRSPENDTLLLVTETSGGEFVGVINSHTCDRRTGTFSYGIAVLAAHQRKGYASRAITILMRYFFDELRYQKCTIDIYDFNAGSIMLHEHLGFRKEGHLRRMGFTEGRHFDILWYGMTIEEFRESR